MSKTLKVHWLFDPADGNPNLTQKIAGLLENLQKEQPLEIQPLYFCDNRVSEWGAEFSSDFQNSYKHEIKVDMKEQLASHRTLRVSEPQILDVDASSRRGMAVEVDRFLAEQKSDLVVLATHARTGIQRIVLGSFTESLLLRCSTPLLLVSPYTHEDFSLKEVFYPTDFSKQSKDLFEKVLNYPFLRGKSFHLFTKLIAPFAEYERGMQVALQGGLDAIQNYEKAELGRIQDRFEEWKKTAEEFQVSVDLQQGSTTGNLNDVMLETIDRIDPDLIVMPSMAGPVDALFVGSVAVDIIRNCKRPVLVQHMSS